MTNSLSMQSLSSTNERQPLVTGSIPFLPPEIHLVLAQHVHRDDLPNYRLASKLLNEIGKPELFRVFILRNTLASVSRLKHVTKAQHLSQLVQTLIWDVNAWRVGPNVRDWHEWTRHCATQASLAKPDQAALYLELAASRQHWEAYLSRLEDEKAAIQELWILITRYGLTELPEASFLDLELPNVSKVCIFKSTSYRIENGRVCRLRGQSVQGSDLSVSRPLSTWRGDSFQDTMSQKLLAAVFAVVASVRKLRFHGLTIENHTRLWRQATQSLPKPTSLHIRCSISSASRYEVAQRVVLHKYLSLLPEIECLHFDLGTRSRAANTSSTHSKRTIQDTFGFEGAIRRGPGATDAIVTWPKLRKLSLSSFDSNSKALSSLLTRHSSTLKDLRLRAIIVKDTEMMWSSGRLSWQEIFAAVGKPPNLTKVVIRDLCRAQRRTDGQMVFEYEEAAHAADYWIVNILKLPIERQPCI